MKTKFNLALLAIFFSVLFLGCQNKESKSVKFISWGGKFQNDLIENWISPVSNEANIKLSAESWNGDYGILTSRILKGINTWDVIHVEDHYINNIEAANIFEEFNTQYNGEYPEELHNKYGIPLLQYGYILTYDSIKVQQNNVGWNSFFDASKISGKRGVRDFPIGNIEIALLSIGRDINTVLYDPLLDKSAIENQLNDAFKVFSSIKDELVWWTSGDQLQKGMESGEFTMVAAWSGRVWSLNKSEGIQSSMIANPNSALISTDWLVIPKGGKNIESSKELLLNLYKNPKYAEDFSLAQGYLAPAVNSKIKDSGSEKYLNYGSSKNPNGILINSNFWSKNYSWISQSWNKWRLENK